MAASLCGLAKTLPELIGNLLDRERKLKRGRFREETLTDIFTALLAPFAGPNLIIEYPPEAPTGGDIDLDFWEVATSRRLLVRIQAKRLSAEKNNGKPVKVRHRSYRELLHFVDGEYQFRTLVNKSGNYLPLYMFYNHESVTLDGHFHGTAPKISGINLAFASDVAKAMEAKLAAAPKRLHHKRLSHLHPHLFPLEAILCPPGPWDDDVPSPDAVTGALRKAWNSPAGGRKRAEQEDRLVRFMLEPELIHPRGDMARRPADGPAIRYNDDLDRPRVTFISGRTEDERTPRISDVGA